MGKHSLTQEETRALIARAQAGDREAEERLMAANSGLVTRVVWNRNFDGMEREDLLQAARLGLLHAIRTYDPGRNVAFSTHAMWQMRAAVMHERRIGPLIRLPAWILEGGWGHERASDPPRVTHSLDWRVLDKDEGGDLLADFMVYDPDIEGQVTRCCNWIMPFVDRLEEMERRVIIERFGLDNRGSRSIREIVRETGRSIEGIRLIQNRALARLRKWVQEEGNYESCD